MSIRHRFRQALASVGVGWFRILPRAFGAMISQDYTLTPRNILRRFFLDKNQFCFPLHQVIYVFTDFDLLSKTYKTLQQFNMPDLNCAGDACKILPGKTSRNGSQYCPERPLSANTLLRQALKWSSFWGAREVTRNDCIFMPIQVWASDWVIFLLIHKGNNWYNVNDQHLIIAVSAILIPITCSWKTMMVDASCWMMMISIFLQSNWTAMRCGRLDSSSDTCSLHLRKKLRSQATLFGFYYGIFKQRILWFGQSAAWHSLQQYWFTLQCPQSISKQSSFDCLHVKHSLILIGRDFFIIEYFAFKQEQDIRFKKNRINSRGPPPRKSLNTLTALKMAIL